MSNSTKFEYVWVSKNQMASFQKTDKLRDLIREDACPPCHISLIFESLPHGHYPTKHPQTQ